MKEKLINLCGTLLLIAFAAGCGWTAVEMFRQGAWMKGLFVALGALLFAAPLLVPPFSKPATPEVVPPLVPEVDLPEDEESLLALARQVAGDDEGTMRVVMESLENPETFYPARAMASGEYATDYREMWEAFHDKPDWLRSEGLRYVLTEAKAIVMFDWKDSLDAFVDGMQELRRVRCHRLPVPEDMLDEAADIPHWCHALNGLWQPLGYETMFIDTKADEYLVAVVPYSPNPYIR